MHVQLDGDKNCFEALQQGYTIDLLVHSLCLWILVNSFFQDERLLEVATSAQACKVFGFYNGPSKVFLWGLVSLGRKMLCVKHNARLYL